MKAGSKREGPLKVDLPFDEAIRRAFKVTPPPEGWAEYERNLKASQKRRKPAKSKD